MSKRDAKEALAWYERQRKRQAKSGDADWWLHTVKPSRLEVQAKLLFKDLHVVRKDREPEDS